MKQNRSTLLKYSSWACALLAIFLVALQFVPFWNADGHSASIASYIWLPMNHEPLTAWLTGAVQGYTINSLIWPPIFALVAGIFGLVLLAVQRKTTHVTRGCYALCGLFAVITSFNPAFRFGNTWMLYLTFGLLLLLTAVGGVILCVNEASRT